MCNIFVGADPTLWDNKAKSVRIDGFVTSIRMENAFWIALEEIAYRDQMTVNQLIQTLYNESVEAGHDMTNFTSFLRVCALRYHSLIAVGEVSPDPDVPIYNGEASDILAREATRRLESELAWVGRAS